MDATEPLPSELCQDYDASYLSPPWSSYGRSLTLGIVSLAGKLVLHVLNSCTVERGDLLQSAIDDASSTGGLITVSNHASTIDDPFLFCAMLPLSFFFTEHVHERVRWSICAREMCYKGELLSQFFKSGKTLPIERGKGLHQPVMGVVARAVARGDWVHVFPEGKVVFNDGKQPVGDLKWGIGKLCCDSYLLSGRVPTVLPFHHTGMTSVLPKGHMVPRAGHQVEVRVGKPIDLRELVRLCRTDEQCAWRKITEKVRDGLNELADGG
jgi:monolysocardiolipin acyltransferase